MLKKILIDLNFFFSNKPIYKISNHLNSDFMEYPFIFDETLIRSGKRQRLIQDFDDDGIPLIKTYIDVDDDGLHYYPITIGQVGISVYQTYLKTKSDIDKNRFLKFADYFENSVSIEGDVAYWLTSVPKPEYHIHTPWKSAFSQSRACSILVRSYLLTKNESHIDLIRKALNQYEKTIDDNGISVRTKHGLFYEEYAANQATMVLDGHFFALFGLIDLIKAKPHIPEDVSLKAEALLQSGLASVKDVFSQFDLGFWLKFNLCEMDGYPEIDPCTVNYMKIISEQMMMVSHFTNDAYFAEKANHVNSYITLGNMIKSYQIKYKSLKALNRL